MSEPLPHNFRRPELLARAFTHASFSADNNERMEWLGDALLAGAVSVILFAKAPNADEGALSRLRQRLVSTRALAKIARQFGVEKKLKCGEKVAPGDRMLASALEAYLAAVWLDQGDKALHAAAAAIFGEQIDAYLKDADVFNKDAKSLLQELLQKTGRPPPVYESRRIGGADHAPRFAVRCVIGGECRGEGEGSSHARAALAAAAAALRGFPKQSAKK